MAVSARGTGERWPSRPALLVLVFMLSVAGCVGGAAKPVATGPTTAETVPGRVVEGTVVDVELKPIEAASVSHVGGTANASTDSQGGFRLVGLPADAGLLLKADHAGHKALTLRVDLQYVQNATVRFMLPLLPTNQSYHRTVATVGEITCQVAAGSHHGFPGYYEFGCRDISPDGKDEVRVPIDPGAVSALVELSWTPQSPAADVMGLTVTLRTPREELLLGEVHAELGEHYARLYSGTTPFEVVAGPGHALHSIVDVGPGLTDDHVPNAGAAVQQKFTVHTTAFYGAPPPPTWSYLNQ